MPIKLKMGIAEVKNKQQKSKNQVSELWECCAISMIVEANTFRADKQTVQKVISMCGH